MDEGSVVDAVFLDFRKAFDVVPQNIHGDPMEPLVYGGLHLPGSWVLLVVSKSQQCALAAQRVLL